MLRFILVASTVVLFLILALPVMLIEKCIGKKDPARQDRHCRRIIQAAFRLILWETGADITVRGLENIPKDTAVLYIGNHRSYFDILLSYVNFPGITGFVAKKEMEKVPLLSVWMNYIHCLFLDRNDIKQGLKTILTAIDMVKNGISVCIFPEGTRNKAESELDLMEFHEGSFKVASKSGCPIIPVAITGSADMYESRSSKRIKRVKPAKVIIEFGQPILFKELEKENQRHIGAYTRDILLEMLTRNRKELG